jgi:hypothetical protein
MPNDVDLRGNGLGTNDEAIGFECRRQARAVPECEGAVTQQRELDVVASRYAAQERARVSPDAARIFVYDAGIDR